MRTVVLDRDLLELEIKPQAMLEEYSRLLENDVKSLLADPKRLRRTDCPACLSKSHSRALKRYGLAYRECDRCRSLFVSPRPTEDALAGFYVNSNAARYWREKIQADTRETRREKVYRPRVNWVLDVLDRHGTALQSGIVVGYHSDLLIDELARIEKSITPLIVTNPVAEIEFAGHEYPGVTVKPTPIAGLAQLGPAAMVLAFDFLDRCADPDGFVGATRGCLAPGGLLFATTTLISGFDLQVLWDRSKNIYPPDRLNLLSAEGLSALLERHEFEMLEFSTPGMFDVEIVRRAVLSDPKAKWPRFIRYLVESRDENALSALQEYLQRFRLSSFARVVARKKP